MSTQTLSLGTEITLNEERYLVVSIVDSSYLFEVDDGTWERLEEKYAQLKGRDGDIQFITFNENYMPFLDKRSTIKALPRQPWRKK